MPGKPDSYASAYKKYFSKDCISLSPVTESEFKKYKEKAEKASEKAYYYDDDSKGGFFAIHDDDMEYTKPSNSANSYQTNNQVEGVNEADIAKFDGKYFYYINKEEINHSTRISLSIFDIEGNRLVYDQDIFERDPLANYKMQIYDRKVIIYSQRDLSIYKFDGTKLKEQYKIENMAIEETRLLDDYLYFSYTDTQKYHNVFKNNIKTYILDFDSFACNVHLIKYNLKTNELKEISVIGNRTNAIYMNKDYIVLSMPYIYTCKDTRYYHTFYYRIYNKYSANFVFDLDLNCTGVFFTKGAVNDQYSIDIYNNQLRIVTTDSDSINRLTIFDLENKVKLSCLEEGIGLKDEKVKSVTYKENICYIVTYKQTDPLYSIDLSDPTNPKIVSDLHVDGYSSYLKTFTIGDVEYIFGAGKIDTCYKYSIYKNDGNNTQVGSDYVMPCFSYQYVLEDGVLVETPNDGAKSMVINPHAMFFYQDDDILYVGAPKHENKYSLFKIDVNDLDNVISLYKEFDTKNESRLFLVEGMIYIPEVDDLIIESF